MSIARHHAEWLSLLEISGPFLSMPVLMDAFPQGLDTDDPQHAQELRAAYEEWLDNQGGLQSDPAVHQAWIRYVLQNTLELPDEVLAVGQAIQAGLKASVPEHHETLRPDLIVHEPGGGKARLLIQVYPPEQELENAIPGRSWKASPATRMMELLHATELRLGLVTNGEHWLLVQATRGETTGYASWYANLWAEERLTLRAFHTLLGVQRFFGVPEEEILEALLDRSAEDQHEVTDQLGSQVRNAVEILIRAVDRADQDRGRKLLDGMDEKRLYEAALTVMMRLVFLLAAEERGLLLLGEPIYDQHYAVSTLRGRLREMADRHGEDVLERRYDAWSRLLATFRAVYGGIEHENLRLPAYGGSLFDPDRFPFLEGRPADTDWRTHPADPLSVNNRTVLHLLEALQVLLVSAPGGVETARTLSFRALDIEQIGHVYEGLLDHEAVRATEPVVGLQGTKYKEPELPLSELETRLQNGEKELIGYLRKQTGRTEGALRNGLHDELDAFRAERLHAACGNDIDLYERVQSFAGLIRDDDYDFPVVIPADSVYVTEGPTRRQTGTHYTPRSLTEPIVQHTLEPLIYEGPAEGKPRADWQLRSPKEILDLKVCDMAMGSGAFLVQTCRYLSERLVEAWDEVLASREQGDDKLQITPEGKRATGDPTETILPESDEERLTLARRLVVDRCLYGVDKNYLAVEIAKLSLWLVTLDKNRPFTFLNHALKVGDSIIGADEEMFLQWSQSLKGPSASLYYEENERDLTHALHKRRELHEFAAKDIRDVEVKERLFNEAESALERIHQSCDLIVGTKLQEDLTTEEQEEWLAELLIEHTAKEHLTSQKARRALGTAHKHGAFHWPFEFPEVFKNGGFDGIVGNPPYMYGTIATQELGETYMYYVRKESPPWHGKADLVVGFFKRGVEILKEGSGNLSLIATSSLIRGETLESGLADLVSEGFIIYNARSPYPWPGRAGVEVVNVSLTKSWDGVKRLDGQPVAEIGLNLKPGYTLEGTPEVLKTRSLQAMLGVKLSPNNIELSYEEFTGLARKFQFLNRFVVPVIGGQELNSLHDLSLSPHAIDPSKLAEFEENRQEELEQLPFSIKNSELYKHSAPAKTMNKMIRIKRLAFACGETSVHAAFAKVPTTGPILKHKAIVFPADSWATFAFLQSNIHTTWAWRWGLRREARLVYSPKRCARTFPLAEELPVHLEEVARTYHAHRQKLLMAREEGLTPVYNRFHNADETSADTVRLRELHVKMDNAVAAAYGWDDLDLGHGFRETDFGSRFTISEQAERQVLTRLLKLNHERYEEEVRQGLHEKAENKRKKKRKQAAKRKKNDAQLSLF